ncbi:PREDICTED: tRNA modification GTPase GTPBP3, mitochondrial isoform X1 [Bactrocera latifrons]|uniref:tRNA modification GTPase GTPBP3, mitochondrial n=1 Tax=Bactrocera latifrons TaxID=174628 RepID=A0A0K8V2Q2_BACLA|nr:PREDICTED: tRNA modification GTPase GTPBP3, mitochondrial isoform X1 [Bactrocera latifrons]
MNRIYKMAKAFKYSSRCSRNLSNAAADCTIFSLSSGFGKCGVSVIRVSGPQTRNALQTLVGNRHELKARYAYLRSIYHPETKEIIDKGLVLWFPAPASFTGEDSCEFQVHGSLAVIAALLDALGKVPGLRPATAGEFTKRAFYGGKIDLTEVEGLADLIHAETEAQRKQAMLQSTGALSRVYDNWRKRLISCAAHLEAYIDFAEEENIEDDVVLQLTKELHLIITEIRDHLNDQRQGEMLRNGVRTAIVGAPNVGKSSFLNMICQREIAIVTPIAGTTRDIIESTHNFGGYPVVFADTAGLHKHTKDMVELEGISRAKECLQNADLILLLTDAQELLRNITTNKQSAQNYQTDYLKQLDLDANKLIGKRIQLIANKIDLLSTTDLQKLAQIDSVLKITCKQPPTDIVQPFLRHFEKLLYELCGEPTAEHPRITHARYRQQLERCNEHLHIFLHEYAPDIFPDTAISAQKLRNALKCIERITGHVSTDDILDVVFKDFCIGK